MEFKDVIVTQIKQEGDEGIVEGFAAIMGNVDHQGDRIHQGAFTQTLNRPPDGMPQLLGWQHNLDHPFGRTTSLTEVGRDELPPEILKRAPDATGGLKFKARIAISSSTNKDRLALMKDEAQVMKGASIGFDTLKADFSVDRTEGATEERIREIREVRLWEVSVVALGANSAAAVTSAKDKEGNVDKEDKRAVPPHTTAKAPEAEAWDGPAARAAAEISDLKVMAAIVLDKGETKGDYKLIHHQPGEGHKVVFRGIAAAAAVLAGGRGGVNASEAEKAGARRHLARHYDQFDREPPWESAGLTIEALKEYTAGEREVLGIRAVTEAIEACADEFEAWESPKGAGLSKRSRTRIASALRILQEVIDAAEAEEEAARHPKKELDLELRIRTAEQEAAALEVKGQKVG